VLALTLTGIRQAEEDADPDKVAHGLGEDGQGACRGNSRQPGQQAVSAKPASIKRWAGWRTPVLMRQMISDTNRAAANAWLQKLVSVNSADMGTVSDKFTNKH